MASSFKLSTDICVLLMVGKYVRGGICLAIYRYTKDINKYMKDYDKNKESSYLKYWDVKNCMVGKCHQSFQ